MPIVITQNKQVPVSAAFSRQSPEKKENSRLLALAVTSVSRKKSRQPPLDTSDKADWPVGVTSGLPNGLTRPTSVTTANVREEPESELSQPRHSWSEMPENIVPSAVNTATGLWDMITHPQRTAETLVDAAQGGVDRIMPEQFTNFMDTYVSPRSPETKERQRQVSDAVGQSLKDRYWGIENIKNTMITDPVGIALDVGGIAAGGLGMARGPLAIGSRVRLAEAPAAALGAGRPTIREFGHRIAGEVRTPPVAEIDDRLKYVVTADGKRRKIYAPPDRPQRPFEADYTDGVGTDQVDEAGNLLVDRQGRPLDSQVVVGRRTLGGDDIGANHREFKKIGRGLLGKPFKLVPREHIEGKSGTVLYDPHTNKPRDVLLADNLDMTKSRSRHIVEHEISHLLDLKTGREAIPPHLREELEPNYSTLASGEANQSKLTLPRDHGYSGDARIRDELVTEAWRAAIKNPNYMKTVAPKTYEWLADLLSRSPEAGRWLRLNSLAAATVGALGAAAQKNESQAAEIPAQHSSQTDIPKRTRPTLGSIPFGRVERTTGNHAYGPAKVATTLARLGSSSQDAKSGKLRGVVRALVEAKQKPQFYGGPR